METHTLDASTKPIGRIATEAARLLMGKHRPSFQKHIRPAVRVAVIQSDKLVLTGRKWRQKTYHRHSGYIGNLKTFSAEWMRDHDSRQIVRLAVSGMLPKNKLRARMMYNLRVYPGAAPEA